MTLTEFQLARLAEDEAGAGDIHEAGCFSSDWSHDRLVYNAAECNCPIPARVLAECAAKRAIVAEFRRRDMWLNMLTLVEPARTTATAMRDALVPVMHLLAQPYADHPDFDPAWRTP